MTHFLFCVSSQVVPPDRFLPCPWYILYAHWMSTCSDKIAFMLQAWVKYLLWNSSEQLLQLKFLLVILVIIRSNQTPMWVVTKILCKMIAAGNRGEERYQLSNDSILVVLTSSSHILHPSMLCQSLAAIFYQYFIQHLVIKHIYYKEINWDYVIKSLPNTS